MRKAHNAFQQAVWRVPRSPCIWITIGIFYYKINQYRDSFDALTRSITLNPMIWQAWFNMAILYEGCKEQTYDAHDCFTRCLELKPDFPDVAARLKVIEDHNFKNVPTDFRFENMRDCELRTFQDIRSNDKDVDIAINSLKGPEAPLIVGEE